MDLSRKLTWEKDRAFIHEKLLLTLFFMSCQKKEPTCCWRWSSPSLNAREEQLNAAEDGRNKEPFFHSSSSKSWWTLLRGARKRRRSRAGAQTEYMEVERGAAGAAALYRNANEEKAWEDKMVFNDLHDASLNKTNSSSLPCWF